MTPAPKPWPEPGDPRHETAVEAAHWMQGFGLHTTADVIAAYHAKLAEQGVVLVPRERCARDSDWCDGAILPRATARQRHVPRLPKRGPRARRDEH